MCGVIGGFFCAAPGELASSGILWGSSLVGYFIHRGLTAREEEEAKGRAASDTSPPAATL
jgi:hypothetical protein